MMSVKQTVGQDPNKITALYERLSRDDDQVGDSNSIVNQKKYLESYAEQKGYTNIQHYTDDGWSGGNFNRPAWKQLEADIEAGKVAHVIVKDMSRIGRDYLQTGFYTEVFFREHGVHFIAIANSVDSDDQNSNEFAPFLNIMNEWYLRDLSRKQRTSIRVKGESGKAAQADGWEKQYPYKVGHKKVYMPPSEAEKHGYERASKHPKSTKFGRQNPIAERWNSEEQLVEWRRAWADVTNRYLKKYGHDERIDHRSHADRGLTEQPTIHEGVVARALEKKGILSDRCEVNRQIKADNALLRELKATVKKLMQAVKNTVPAIAEAMEKVRSSMLIFSYQLRHIGVGKYNMGKRVKAVKPELERYAGLVQQIKDKSKERKALLAEKKETPFYQIPKLHDLTRRITELTEELEELKTEKEMLLHSLDCTDDAGISAVKKEIAALEGALQKLSEQETKYSAELDEALKQHSELNEQAAGMDTAELMDARLAVREEMERSAVDRVKAAYGEKYDPIMMHDSKRDVANLLHEEAEARSIRERLRQKQQQQAQRQKRQRYELDR